MRITIEGFGSIWSTREREGLDGNARVAYYNTTGIADHGKMRHRTIWFGQLRFNGVGGFDPKSDDRNRGRVFECAGDLGRSRVQLFPRRLLHGPVPPDYFLFALRSERTGFLPIGWHAWKSDGVLLISWSQLGRDQEAMVLMPADSWIRGAQGWFVAEPFTDRPWRARLHHIV